MNVITLISESFIFQIMLQNLLFNSQKSLMQMFEYGLMKSEYDIVFTN